MVLSDKDLEFFEKKNAMYVLLAVKYHPGSTKQDIMRLEENVNDRTKQARIGEAIKIGYLSYTDIKGKHGGELNLTPKGVKITDRIIRLRATHIRLKDADPNLKKTKKEIQAEKENKEE